MPALLIVVCLFATVPPIEAAPLTSRPSLSSSTAILVAAVLVIAAFSLVVGLVFFGLKRWKWKRGDANAVRDASSVRIHDISTDFYYGPFERGSDPTHARCWRKLDDAAQKVEKIGNGKNSLAVVFLQCHVVSKNGLLIISGIRECQQKAGKRNSIPVKVYDLVRALDRNHQKTLLVLLYSLECIGKRFTPSTLATDNVAIIYAKLGKPFSIEQKEYVRRCVLRIVRANKENKEVMRQLHNHTVPHTIPTEESTGVAHESTQMLAEFTGKWLK